MPANDFASADGQTYYKVIYSGTGAVGSPIVPQFALPYTQVYWDLLRTSLLSKLFQTPLRYGSLAAATSGVIKSSSGTLLGIACTNQSGLIGYIQLFNRTTVPTNGTVPLRSYPVYGGGGQTQIDGTMWGGWQSGTGLPFSVGIAWGFSTTALTYTARTITDCTFEASYL